MADRIRALPPELVGRIAAGEVVERPASALKELVENSLDAGAKRIDIEVGRGGTELIRVVDDGSGIHPEDLELALANHATSKLASPDDLAEVATLGFRGEALASLGAVAQLTLQSRPPELPLGAEVVCRGGHASPVRSWSGPPGTRVEAKHLFFNTPARKKFLRSVATEFGHVQESFIRLALAKPGVHFTLTHDGKLVYEVPAGMGLLDRVGLFFGAEVANALFAVKGGQGGARVSGYVADPSCDRPGPSLQYLFVGGRWVRDRGAFSAVQEAYKGLLMTGRYPVAFLFLEVPPGEVDVNAHPAKSEVRFRDRGAVYALLRQAVRDRLGAAELTARGEPLPRKATKDEVAAQVISPPGPAPRASPVATGPTGGTPTAVPAPVPSGRELASGAAPGRPAAATPSGAVERAVPPPHPQGPAAAPGKLFPPAAEQRAVASRNEPGPPVRAMQVLGCYLVVALPPDEVLFVDQHALHERILFEKLLARLENGPVESQRLLMPEPIDLPVAQAALVLEHRAALAELGLLVEGFGGPTVLLSGYPAALGRRPRSDLLRAVAECLAELGRVPDRRQLLNDLAALAACHAAVRAGDKLSDEEIRALLARRDLARDAHHCPHGRPTSVVFARRDFERLFKRT